MDKLQKKIRAFNQNRQTLRYYYIRYADDWIFISNATLEFAQTLKDLFILFTEWISTNLKLELHTIKTKITDCKSKDKIEFLGFQLSYAIVKRIQQIGIKIKYSTSLTNRTKLTITYKSNPKVVFKQRTTNPTLIAAWDRDRVLKRLTDFGFISKRKGIRPPFPPHRLPPKLKGGLRGGDGG